MGRGTTFVLGAVLALVALYWSWKKWKRMEHGKKGLKKAPPAPHTQVRGLPAPYTGNETTLDQLSGDWKIFQLKKGHRFSNDDLFTAWRASLARPRAAKLLDIGCGLCSVGLSTLKKMENPDSTLIGVEVQPISFTLASATVKHNRLDNRVTLINNDLRSPDLLPPGSQFDLITGSPPYIPIDKGVQSPNAQKAGARIELKGSVYDYCETARRYLAPGGVFCFVMVTTDPRTEDAPAKHGLKVIEKWDYTFKEGRNAHICTMVCMRQEDVPENHERRYGHMLLRKADGNWTEDYMSFRLHMVGQSSQAQGSK